VTIAMPGEETRIATPGPLASHPLAALELPDIPDELHFVRDYFPAPALDAASWSLKLTGSTQSLVLDLDAPQSFSRRTLSVVLECAGHRRAEFAPIPPGVPWTTGAGPRHSGPAQLWALCWSSSHPQTRAAKSCSRAPTPVRSTGSTAFTLRTQPPAR